MSFRYNRYGFLKIIHIPCIDNFFWPNLSPVIYFIDYIKWNTIKTKQDICQIDQIMRLKIMAYTSKIGYYTVYA
jgi:hypothetical protein